MLECYILPLYVACLPQSLTERSQDIFIVTLTPRVENSDHRHPRLLRARRNRPRGRAAEQRNEVPPPHSITSSARASSIGGTSRPSALADFRLIASSNLVGCCTGRSAGLAPLRMRST